MHTSLNNGNKLIYCWILYNAGEQCWREMLTNVVLNILGFSEQLEMML